MPSAQRGTLCAVCLLGIVCALLIGSYHRQLAFAASRAQERLAAVERGLKAEREARLRAESRLCPDATNLQQQPQTPPPSTEAIRQEARNAMRKLLLQVAQDGTSVLTAEEAEDNQVEWARFELREALAAEDPGWCSCPPPPNITKLCRALLPHTDRWELEAVRAQAEANSLRRAILEANARAQEASERALQAVAQLTAAHTSRIPGAL